MTGQLKILETLPVKNGLQVWGDGHRKLVEPCLNSDVEWVQRELDVPVEAINSTLEADLVAPYQVRAALEAEQEGFDAVVLGCKLEPGVQAAKEACRIPVVSELEAALHVACMVARRFSLLIPGRGPADTNVLWELVAEDSYAAERLIDERCWRSGENVRRTRISGIEGLGRLARPADEARLRAVSETDSDPEVRNVAMRQIAASNRGDGSGE